MASIRRFEELEAWQQARRLTKLIYQISSNGSWAKDFGLRDQIRRASVSVMSNIAEGFERRGAVEFSRFLLMAKASAGEVRSQLYIALDMEYIDQKTFDELCRLAEKISGMIAGLANYLRGKPRPTVQPFDLQTF